MIGFVYSYIALCLLQVPIGGGIFGGSSAGSIFFAALDLIVFFTLIMQALLRRSDIKTTPTVRWIIYLLLYAGASSLWSISNDIEYGIALLLREFVRVLNIVIICHLFNDKKILLILKRAVIVASIVYPIMAFATMSYAYDLQSGEGRLMYAGYKDANPVARDVGLLIIMIAWCMKINLFKYGNLISITFISLVLLFFAVFSKTTTIALVVAILSSFSFYKSNYRRKLLGFIAFAFFVVAVLLVKFDYLYQYVFEVQNGSALATLSGRTLIWDVAIEYLFRSFLYGMGINSFSIFSSEVLPNAPGQAHNEFLQILFSYGVIGLILLGRVVYEFFHSRRGLSIDASRIIIMLCVFYFVIGLTEANLVTTIAPLWLIAFISYSAGSASRISKNGFAK